jgi:hypothetical protein
VVLVAQNIKIPPVVGSIGQVISSPGDFQAGIPVGTAATSLIPNLENVLLRFGEVALGIVLLAIGLNALLKNPVGKTVKAVA